jgi:hypothetical protein
MKTVDSSGVVVNEYEYDVYGTLRSSSGSQDIAGPFHRLLREKP